MCVSDPFLQMIARNTLETLGIRISRIHSTGDYHFNDGRRRAFLLHGHTHIFSDITGSIRTTRTIAIILTEMFGKSICIHDGEPIDKGDTITKINLVENAEDYFNYQAEV